MRAIKNFPLAGAFAVAALLTAGPTLAANGICSVEPTADGHVELRTEPNAGSVSKARIKPGEVIVLHWQGHEPVMSGNWYSVSHYPGRAFPPASDPAHRKVKRGWLHYSQLDGC